MTNGYYYLHTNGELIYKPAVVVESDPQYFDSDFVKRFWPIDTTNREDCWKIILEALWLKCSIQRAKDLAGKWGCNYQDSIEMLKRMKPTSDMQDGMTIFIKEILGMEVDKYWQEIKSDWRK